ncbi:CAP domain-containing protein [Thermodesulfobacteriota bacterium]
MKSVGVGIVRTFVAGVLVAAIYLGSVGSAQAAFRWYGPYFNQRVAANIFHFVNKERQKRRIPVLRRAVTWNWVATKHSIHMVRTRVFAHNSSRFPVGWRTVGQRFRQGRPIYSNYRYAENIAWMSNYKSMSASRVGKAFVDMWMASAGHRANILNRRLLFMGVGFQGGYATQFFSNQPGRRIR